MTPERRPTREQSLFESVSSSLSARVCPLESVCSSLSVRVCGQRLRGRAATGDHRRMLTPAYHPDQPSTVPLADEAAVIDRIRFILGDGLASRRTLWLLFLDGARVQLPVIVPIDDLPIRPDPGLMSALTHVLQETIGHESMGRSVVLVLERPGSSHPIDGDRAWTRSLQTHLRAAGVSLHGVYLAAAGDVSRLFALRRAA